MAKFRQPAAGSRPRAASVAPEPFWRSKPLEAMSSAEWESLCDGCARCCLMKLEDIDTGEIAWTDVACGLLEETTCRCRDYADRHARVPDCIALDAKAVRSLTWLPPTCAYRRLAEGHDLAPWHPLVSGSVATVHEAGVSVLGRTVSEVEVDVDDLEDHVVDWPAEEGD